MLRAKYFYMSPDDGDGSNSGGSGNLGGGDSGASSGGGDSGNQGGDNSGGGDSGNQGGNPEGGSGNSLQNQGDGKGDSGNSMESLPEWAQKEIKTLRSENAKSRTQNNALTDRFNKFETGLKTMLGQEGDDLTPEQRVEQVSQENVTLSFDNALLSSAVRNGISGEEEMEFFDFLMRKAVNGLGDDQELSDDEIAAIVQKVKGKTKGAANSSVGDGKDGAPNPDGKSDVTLDQFTAMNVLQKSVLYQKSPDVYNSLLNQAKKKGVLI